MLRSEPVNSVDVLFVDVLGELGLLCGPCSPAPREYSTPHPSAPPAITFVTHHVEL